MNSSLEILFECLEIEISLLRCDIVICRSEFAKVGL